RKGSMFAAIIAVAIAVLVIVINYVTFDGVANAIIRDLVDYRFGHILITDRDGNIDRPDGEIIGFLDNTGLVEGATVRLTSVASINNTRSAVPVRAYGVPVIGVLPAEETGATRLADTIVQGSFLTSRDSIILGSSVAEDLNARIGDPLMLKVTDESGNEQTKRFFVVGISKTAGGLGFDTSAIVDIKALRDMTGSDESSELIVRLYDQRDSSKVAQLFSARYAGERFKVETIEEAGESILEGIRSGIAFINLVGYFGMLSSAFGIITIMMMIVTSKIREIGVMRAIGSNKLDVMIIFVIQGTLIGAMGAALGFVLGSAYALYAQNVGLSFGESLSLAVRYDPAFVANTAITGLVMGVVASLYPAWRTTKLEPAEATRY
ncbi:MAG TPA: FtsX-like permease family protein, partial [Nitrososphaera sp.]|nr:FtsX-like permease family protein [Nitrososphaera sp.]